MQEREEVGRWRKGREFDNVSRKNTEKNKKHYKLAYFHVFKFVQKSRRKVLVNFDRLVSSVVGWKGGEGKSVLKMGEKGRRKADAKEDLCCVRGST